MLKVSHLFCHALCHFIKHALIQGDTIYFHISKNLRKGKLNVPIKFRKTAFSHEAFKYGHKGFHILGRTAAAGRKIRFSKALYVIMGFTRLIKIGR